MCWDDSITSGEGEDGAETEEEVKGKAVRATFPMELVEKGINASGGCGVVYWWIGGWSVA